MVVIYAEKHSLAKAIADALGAGSRIKAYNKFASIGRWEFTLDGESAVLIHGAGHIGTLAQPEYYGERYGTPWNLDAYPCIPGKHVTLPAYQVNKYPDTKEGREAHDYDEAVFTHAKSWLRKAEWIINATDPDREGELIFAYLQDISGIKDTPWKRVNITDLTVPTIQKAFSGLIPGEQMTPLQLAGRARAIADWVIGVNLTTAATMKFLQPKNGGMSVGRVVTPTLAMIVNRENDILSHVRKPYFKVVGEFSSANGESFVAEREHKTFKAEHSHGKFDERSAAEQVLNICKGNEGYVNVAEQKTKSESAPLLYNATSLQAAAGTILGWDLDKTVKVMQRLYEKKHMSYPRTSSEHLPWEMSDDVIDTIERLMQLPEYSEFAREKSEWTEFTKRHFDNSKVGSHTAIIPTTEIPASLKSLDEDEFALYDLLVKSLLRVIMPKYSYIDTNVKITVANQPFCARGKEVVEIGWRVIPLAESKENAESPQKLPHVCVGDYLKGEYSLADGVSEPPKRFTESSLILAMETAGAKCEDEEARQLLKSQKKGLGTDATRAAIVAKLFAKKLIEKDKKTIRPTEKGLFLIETLPIENMKKADLTGEWEKRLNEIAETDDILEAKARYNKFLSDIIETAKLWYGQIKNAHVRARFGVVPADAKKCPACGGRILRCKPESKSYYFCPKESGCGFNIPKELCTKKLTQSQADMLVNSGKTGIIRGFKGKSEKEFDAALTADKATHTIRFEFQRRAK